MKKILMLIVIVALLVSGCLQFETGNHSQHTVLKTSAIPQLDPAVGEPPESAEAPPETPAETTSELPDTRITLGAVGDVIASSENFQSVKSGDVYEFSSHFTSIRDSLKSQDYTLANLVSPIAGADFGYSGHPRYNAPIELVQALSDIGVDAVSTANRYALDLGPSGLMSNLIHIRELGLKAYGTASSQEEADQLLLVDVQGIKLGLLAYTTIINQSPASTPYAVAMADRERMSAQIQDLREQGAEIICVSMYWGDEYSDTPNAEQLELMRFLESEGVDIVLGSHPHVIQPLVVKEIAYAGKMKPMVQAYSLGNFYSGFIMSRTKTGLMLDINIARENGKVQLESVKHRLVYNHQSPRDDGQTDFELIDLDNLAEWHGDNLYSEMLSEKERAEAVLNALQE